MGTLLRLPRIFCLRPYRPDISCSISCAARHHSVQVHIPVAFQQKDLLSHLSWCAARDWSKVLCCSDLKFLEYLRVLAVVRASLIVVIQLSYLTGCCILVFLSKSRLGQLSLPQVVVCNGYWSASQSQARTINRGSWIVDNSCSASLKIY